MVEKNLYKQSEGLKYMKKHYGLNCDYVIKTNNIEKSQWLAERRKGISGTDISAIAGVTNYSSRPKVYLDKIGEIPKVEDNEKMYWGRVMEDIIAKEFALRNPKFKVRKVNAMLKHIEHSWAIGNIDRLLINEKGERGILEIKTASQFLNKMWEGDTTEHESMVQLQWYMFVADVKYGYFATLIGGNKYVQKYVERDDELVGIIKEMAEDFWVNNVVKRVPPPIDGSKASKELLGSIYPKSNCGQTIQLPGEVLKILSKRDHLKNVIAALDKDLALCENQLKELLKDNEIGICGDRKITWKTVLKNSIDSKKLKEELPEIYEKYCKITSYRKLSIS